MVITESHRTSIFTVKCKCGLIQNAATKPEARRILREHLNAAVDDD